MTKHPIVFVVLAVALILMRRPLIADTPIITQNFTADSKIYCRQTLVELSAWWRSKRRPEMRSVRSGSVARWMAAVDGPCISPRRTGANGRCGAPPDLRWQRGVPRAIVLPRGRHEHAMAHWRLAAKE